MRSRRRRKLALLMIGLLTGLILGGAWWIRRRLAPMPAGPKRYIRWEERTPTSQALQRLQREGVLRDAQVAEYYALFRGSRQTVAKGTYQLAPGETVIQILGDLRSPIVQMLRVPETNWASRTAHLLAKKDVFKATDYMDLVSQPQQFAGDVSFPLPMTSLEGYLYPDTYDLPPLLGARATIVRQLKAFEKQIWERFNHPANLPQVLTEASMVQMEAGSERDEPMVAGVIDNRLAKGMKLQIDATICYALQKWRRLTFADYRNVDSPYNTYEYAGLPPGPICSPDWKCVRAVLSPAHHDKLYYVALPTGQTLYAATYQAHLKNVKLRREEMKELSFR